jgi:rsbT antagonist protein RsbS
MRDQVPMLRMGSDLLITLQGDLDDATVEHIEQVVTREVARAHANGALIDISGLAVVDSFVARVLARLVAMIRLLGAEATIVGIQPAVAITLVELGVPMGHVRTALNAEQGMAQLRGVRRHGWVATRRQTSPSQPWRR